MTPLGHCRLQVNHVYEREGRHLSDLRNAFWSGCHGVKGSGSDSCEQAPAAALATTRRLRRRQPFRQSHAQRSERSHRPGRRRLQGFVATGITLPYTIRFENKPDASLPAQVVTVTQTLDSDLDLNTFQLTTFNFGSYTVNIPAGRDNYYARVDARATTGLFVDITASLDTTTRSSPSSTSRSTRLLWT